MTTLAEEDEDSVNKPFVERSQSVTSRVSQGSQGPGWRANMKGDYDVTNVKPIATKDLLGWGYQVPLLSYQKQIRMYLDPFSFRSQEAWNIWQAKRSCMGI